MILYKPKYIDAIRELVGGNVGGFNDGPIEQIKFFDGQTPPTEKAIQDKLKELEQQYADNEYQRKRLVEYNAIGIGEQLDMIYHDMDAWKAKIKSIKDKFTKP